MTRAGRFAIQTRALRYARHIPTAATPQIRPAPGRANVAFVPLLFCTRVVLLRSAGQTVAAKETSTSHFGTGPGWRVCEILDFQSILFLVEAQLNQAKLRYMYVFLSYHCVHTPMQNMAALLEECAHPILRQRQTLARARTHANKHTCRQPQACVRAQW